MNLLIETVEATLASGHAPDDIVFIGSEESGHSCTWAEFAVIADIEYDDGHGAQEVSSDLIIVFSDKATMWRHEYDGAEWWEYSKPFHMPDQTKPIKHLAGGMWATLAELNK